MFWRWLRAVWAISGSRHQPRSRGRSVSYDRVNVNKPKLRNFDRPLGLPGHLQWSFWRRQRVMSSKYDGAYAWQLPILSVAEQQSDRADVNRRKCGRYTRYLWNFDGPLGLSGRRRQCFDVGNMSSLRKTMARVRDNCRCRLSWSMSPPSPFRNFAENPQFCTFLSPSILRSSISHSAFCFIPTPTTKWARKKSQSLTPAALGGKQFRWPMHEPVW